MSGFGDITYAITKGHVAKTWHKILRILGVTVAGQQNLVWSSAERSELEFSFHEALQLIYFSFFLSLSL